MVGLDLGLDVMFSLVGVDDYLFWFGGVDGWVLVVGEGVGGDDGYVGYGED